MEEDKRAGEAKRKEAEDRVKDWKLTQRVRMVIQLIFLFVFPSAFASAFSAMKEIAIALSEGAELSLTPFARILVFLLVFTIVCGRFFCGYACAFGTLGDWVWQISRLIQKKTGKRIPEIPLKTVRYLQMIKYAVLAIVLILCFFGMDGAVAQNSPWTFFSLLISGTIPAIDMIAGGILLILITAGMAVQSRFFCQFLCPMGAIFSLMPVLPSGQLVRDSENCIKCCKICRRGCPVMLKLGEEDMREGECLRCNRCIALCPRGNIGLKYSRFKASGTVWVIVQAAVLLLMLKFVL